MTSSTPTTPVKDTTYYDCLGVAPEADAGEIKRAYYKKARELHPDKHPGDDKEHFEAQFKLVGEAYQVLSDPLARQRYDEMGLHGFDGATFADPKAFFNSFFGGGKFENIIGEFMLATAAGIEGVQDLAGDDKEKQDIIRAQMESLQEQRVLKLVEYLFEKLQVWVAAGDDEELQNQFSVSIEKERLELTLEPFGMKILKEVGYQYETSGNIYLGKEHSHMLGLDGSYYKTKRGLHMIGGAIGMGTSAISASSKIQAQSKQLQVAEEEVEKLSLRLEAQASQGSSSTNYTVRKLEMAIMDRDRIRQGLEISAPKLLVKTVWKANKLDIGATIASVVEQLFLKPYDDMEAAKKKRRAMAQGLVQIGMIYQCKTTFAHKVGGFFGKIGEFFTGKKTPPAEKEASVVDNSRSLVVTPK